MKPAKINASKSIAAPPATTSGQDQDRPPSGAGDPSLDHSAQSQSGPRAGSKQALVLELLQQPGGTTLDALVAATGWLPHTTRAVLTGLRKKGFRIGRSRGADGRSSYRIAPAGQTEAASAADPEA